MSQRRAGARNERRPDDANERPTRGGTERGRWGERHPAKPCRRGTSKQGAGPAPLRGGRLAPPGLPGGSGAGAGGPQAARSEERARTTAARSGGRKGANGGRARRGGAD